MALSSGVNWLERVGNHSLQSSAKAKHEWRYTFIRPYAFEERRGLILLDVLSVILLLGLRAYIQDSSVFSKYSQNTLSIYSFINDVIRPTVRFVFYLSLSYVARERHISSPTVTSRCHIDLPGAVYWRHIATLPHCDAKRQHCATDREPARQHGVAALHSTVSGRDPSGGTHNRRL